MAVYNACTVGLVTSALEASGAYNFEVDSLLGRVNRVTSYQMPKYLLIFEFISGV